MREIKIETPLGTITALRNDGKGRRVLALHGWLDNAASFVPMAPYLREWDLVAIDLPGHGRSAHLPRGVEYSFAGALNCVLDVADALGWDSFTLLGHSMGAGISSLLAAACPERIEALLAIEMLGSLVETADHTAVRMREAVAAQRQLKDKRLRVFPDIETAIRARQQAERLPGNKLEDEMLRLLVERGVQAVPGGFAWSSDPRLTLPTLTRMTIGQADNLLQHVDCPALIVFGDPAQPYLQDAERRRRVALLPKGRLVVLPGGHHLHMQQPQTVAAALLEFVRG